MHASYLLNKIHKAIYGACKIFIKQNTPSDQNTVHASHLLNKTSPSDQNTVHASYLLNKTHQAIKIGCMQVIY